MSGSFHFLYVVCMTANILVNINAIPMELDMNYNDGNLKKLEVLTSEFQRVLEDMNRIGHELNELQRFASPRSRVGDTVSSEDILRSVQSSKSRLGVNYNTYNTTFNETIPQNCQEVLNLNKSSPSGVYQIRPQNAPKPFMVLCDMKLNGGGWTHIQKRFDGSQDFFLDWREYKFGFGDLGGEFWIGLENINHLTYPSSELLVELVDLNGLTAYAHYESFSVGVEEDGYTLSSVSGYSGSAGDALSYHLGQKFSTKDYDQDKDATENCAEKYYGAWWYNSCLTSNPNGKFINVRHPPVVQQGLFWSTFGSGFPLAQSRLLVKQKLY